MQRLTAPSSCEPHLWTQTFFSYLILNALQQAAGSGLLCTQVMKVMLFFSTEDCSLLSDLAGKAQEKRLFPLLGSIDYHKKS